MPLSSIMTGTMWRSQHRFFEGGPLIAYGGDAALSVISAGLSTEFEVWHGHRMGFAVGEQCSSNGLDDLAEKIAYDFSVFDQHACLAPKRYT